MDEKQFLVITAEEIHEFEVLRGSPLKKIDFEHIPCQEISSVECLNRKPLVSVHMITYNHEKYIAEAIESIVSQKTEFPFELVIGEDCSTDSTREIVLEYQKRYPAIIRVLISEQNVGMNRNGARVTQHCRGEYIAYCEGDDYWTDNQKLQLQYEAFQKYPNAGIIHTDGVCDIDGKLVSMGGRRNYCYSDKREAWEKYFDFKAVPATCSVMLKKEFLIRYAQENPFASVALAFGDLTVWSECLRQKKDMILLNRKMVAYRKNPTSVLNLNHGWINCNIDAAFAAFHYARWCGKIYSKRKMVRTILGLRLLRCYLEKRRSEAIEVVKMSMHYKVFLPWKSYPRFLLLFIKGTSIYSRIN